MSAARSRQGEGSFGSLFHLERAVHDECVHIAFLRVMKSAGQAADQFHAAILPEMNGGLVRAHHEIILHGAVAERLGHIERMQAHGPGNAAPARLRRGHIAAIGDMTAAARLVGREVIGAENVSLFLGHENRGAFAEPIFQRFPLGHVPGQGKGFAFPDHGLENFSDACYLARRPLVSAAVGPFEGQLATFKPYEKDEEGTPLPTYRCLVPEAPAPGSIPTCESAGVLGALTGVMGSLQALEVIKEITGAGESLTGKLLIYDALDTRFRTIKLKHDPANPLNGENASIKDLSHHA